MDVFRYDDFLTQIMEEDDKETFVKHVNLMDLDSNIPKRTHAKFYMYDSVNCATAVLDGATSPVLDYNAAFCHNGLPALHNAAAFECLNLTKLFLEHNEAEANLRCNCQAVGVEGMHLPLNVALEKIRRGHRIFDWDWNRKNSVFKLVFRLCSPYLRLHFEIVRLLAEKTNEIEKEVYYYAKEGKVVELAALLMVACEKVMTTPFPLENNFSGRATIRDFLLAEIASLSMFNARSIYAYGSKKKVQEQKNKKTKLEEILLLLEIFERIGQQLSKYLQLKKFNYNFSRLAEEVAWIFKKGAFNVKCDLFEDIERSVAEDCWHYEYIDGSRWLQGPHYMRWEALFSDTDKSYIDYPTKRSYQQSLSAARRSVAGRSLVPVSVPAPFLRTYSPQLRSYHALPIGIANMDFESTTHPKMEKVQNLKFHKLFRKAFTKALRCV